MKTIGTDVRRVDGDQKVTGVAVYAADVRLPGMLYAACRYTPVTCGVVRRLDATVARAMPGVVAIATCEDVPGQAAIGPIRADHFPLASGRVFCEGDVLAVVAAETPELARCAAAAIEVEVEPTEGIFDLEQAARDDAPSVRPDFPDNVILHYPLRKGDAEAAFATCEHMLDRTYRTGAVEHAYIEPESVTAAPDLVSGGLRVFGSVQNPYSTRSAVAAYMGLPLNRVNVEPSNLGGSFGGKDDTISAMACRAALLCRLCGRPVQLTSSREESIRESYKRHPYIMRYKVGFSADGNLEALTADILADAGAISSQTFFVTWRSLVQATGPYAIPNVSIDIRGVYTNNPYTGAFRGYGSPQVIFAQESLMDEVAEVCGLSPLELRRRNAFEQDAITATGQKLDSHRVALREVLDIAAQRSDYTRKRELFGQPQQGRRRRGIGLALSFRGCSLGAEGTDATSALVCVQSDGSVCIAAALHENGQGLRTTFAQVAAEALGIPLDDIVFLSPQTSWVPDGGPTVASRSTLMGGKAIELAALKVRQALAEAVSADLGDELTWEDGRVSGADGSSLSFAEVAARAVQQGRNLAAFGWFKAPATSWDEEAGQGDAYFTYVYGCQVAEVEVDTITGRVRVERVTAVHDAGRIINPLGALGQVYGGVTQGMGYGVLEDLNIQQGVIKFRNFDEYIIPTAADTPQFDVCFVENPDPAGPYGAKSLGEPTLELAAAAIANAVAQATGKRHRQIPLSLEQVSLGRPLYKPSRQSETATASFEQPSPAKALAPSTLPEALRLLQSPGTRALAGGTDALIAQRAGCGAEALVSLHRLDELRVIRMEAHEVRLGACVTMRDVRDHADLARVFPLLASACRSVGSLQIRNRATLGGNICNAAPCADSVPALLALDAGLELRSQHDRRNVSVAEFIRGAYRTVLRPGEMVVSVTIPRLPEGEWMHLYEKVGRRASVNIGRVSLALLVQREKGILRNVRLATGSLLSCPARLTKLEELLRGKSPREAAELGREAMGDLLREAIGGRWSADWKIPVCCGLLYDMLLRLEDK
ncbi:MAG: molybdopterin-dependent oxidoreductase [Candidatus Cloacimonetes bacterium]|nr:molybdopterin-dependent oxidoreductase [Candidatus Cloacimonadota bacterium]